VWPGARELRIGGKAPFAPWSTSSGAPGAGCLGLVVASGHMEKLGALGKPYTEGDSGSGGERGRVGETHGGVPKASDGVELGGRDEAPASSRGGDWDLDAAKGVGHAAAACG
jgi:hypothetical protein